MFTRFASAAARGFSSASSRSAAGGRQWGLQAFGATAVVGASVYFMTPAADCDTTCVEIDSRAGTVKLTMDTKPEQSPAFVHFPNILGRDLPQMKDDSGAENIWFEDIADSKVEGKEMVAGLFKQVKGPALDYTYTYEEMKYIVEGEFILTDGTGQEIRAKAGDLMYFPKGCKVRFETPSHAIGCFCGQRKLGEGETAVVDQATTDAIASNPKMVHFPQITTRDLPKMVGNDSERNSQTWLGDIAGSLVPGKNMVSGLYRQKQGLALDYTYTYEEMKYIVEGEFQLMDGTGQKVRAKAGDLVYFPAGCEVRFETPKHALGCFCGQREWGSG